MIIGIGNDFIAVTQLRQQHQGKGDEDDQGNIIGDQHGGKEGQQHQHKAQLAQAAAAAA